MTTTTDDATPAVTPPTPPMTTDQKPVEIGGRKGPEPTRFGDWEMNGKCVDF